MQNVITSLKENQMMCLLAFLYGDLEEDIYMIQPEGCDGRVCHLKRCLYGLKLCSKMLE